MLAALDPSINQTILACRAGPDAELQAAAQGFVGRQAISNGILSTAQTASTSAAEPHEQLILTRETNMEQVSAPLFGWALQMVVESMASSDAEQRKDAGITIVGVLEKLLLQRPQLLGQRHSFGQRFATARCYGAVLAGGG